MMEKPLVPKSVAIAMVVAVSLPLLLSVPGVLTFLAGNLRGGERNALAFWMTFIQNGFALFACVMTLRGTRHYWLPMTASVLAFLAWFWLSFSSVPMAMVFAGTLVSVGIGVWSFIVLRKSDTRAVFDYQFDPVNVAGTIVLPRIPKFKIEPTPRNISVAFVLSLCSICLLGIGLGSLLGEGDATSEAYAESLARDSAKAKPLVDLLQKSDGYWDAGNREAAVEGYMQIISLEAYDRGSFEEDHKLDLSRIYGRVVDYRVEKGGPEAARDVIRKASRERVARIAFANPAVAGIVEQERASYLQELKAASTSGEHRGGFGNSSGMPEDESMTSDDGMQVDYDTAFRATQARDRKLRELNAQLDTEGLSRQEYLRRQRQILQEYRDDIQQGQSESSKKASKGKTTSNPAVLKRMGITDEDVNRALGDLKANGLTSTQRRILEEAMAAGMSKEEALRRMAEGAAMRDKSLTPSIRAWMDTPEGQRAMSQNIEKLNNIMRQNQ